MTNNIIEVIPLFLLLSGFVIGLGAVTVIDMHGFLGRKSSYWSEATIRTHKVTKPLIWLGTTLAIIGGVLYFRNFPFTTIPLTLLCIAVVLILNGLFLSFVVSPYLLKQEVEGKAKELLPESWQRKVAFSFIISDLGWWSALFLLAYYLSTN